MGKGEGKRGSYRLSAEHCLAPGLSAHPGEWPERGIRQYVDALQVRRTRMSATTSLKEKERKRFE